MELKRMEGAIEAILFAMGEAVPERLKRYCLYAGR